jgi:hypothetical protein
LRSLSNRSEVLDRAAQPPTVVEDLDEVAHCEPVSLPAGSGIQQLLVLSRAAEFIWTVCDEPRRSNRAGKAQAFGDLVTSQ